MYVVDLIFFLGLVAVTTLISCAAVRMVRPVPAGSMGQAIRALVDWAGMFAIFFGANAVLGAGVILLIRGITPRFIPIYTVDNIHLLVLSAAQAFVFQKWWKGE
jgi:hypothetical protein